MSFYVDDEELNSLYLVDWGTAYDMDVNILSSYTPDEADHIRVVRFCKDCKHNVCGMCELLTSGNMAFRVKEYDYCSFS